MYQTQAMSNFTHLIFDLDGTLVNSKPGLLNALQFMLKKMGVPADGAQLIDRLIGPPIQQGLKEVLHFAPKQVDTGVRLFREYYGQYGIIEAEVYAGIPQLLEELQGQGRKLYVASSKKNLFIPTVLRHFDLDRYFDDLEGAGDGAMHTKAEIITRLMDRNRLLPTAGVVMIGDTRFDMVGGKANEIATIAVGYGFGTEAELRETDPDFYAADVDDLTELLLN